MLVVHGDRPERVRGRQFAGREAAQVVAAPAQRRAVGVGFQQRVNGVFWLVGSQSQPGDEAR
ncbi:MAG: hypothetical protein WA794_04305 [Trebonia sp.]